MKIAPTATKLGALLVLAASMTLTGCAQDIEDLANPDDNENAGQSDNGGAEAPRGAQSYPYPVEDFTYVTEDGTTVQCIAAGGTKALSCDWEGAERPGTEDPEGETSEKVEEK